MSPYWAQMIHVPHQLEGSNKIVIRVMNREIHYDAQQKTGPQYTVVLIGGGAADAKANAGLVARLEAALVKQSRTDKIPGKVKNILALSQTQGAPRTKKMLDTDDWSTSTGILRKTLDNPAVPTADGGFILVGFSAGSAQATALAAALGERCKGLFIIEPAGMDNHNDLMINMVLNGTFDVWKYYRWQGLHPRQALEAVYREILTSMTTSKGAPESYAQLIINFFLKSHRDDVARVYGFPKKSAGETLNEDLITHDRTKGDRTEIAQPVGLLSVLYANVVNLLRARYGISANMLSLIWEYKMTNNPQILDLLDELAGRYNSELRSRDEVIEFREQLLNPNYLKDMLQTVLYELFPQSHRRMLKIDEDGLHSGVLRKNETWEAVAGWIVSLHITKV